MQFKTEEEAIAYAIAESLRLQDTSQIQEEKEEKKAGSREADGK